MKKISTSVAESRQKTDINSRAYISINAFMIKDLHLQGEELLAYAYIHGLNVAGYDCQLDFRESGMIFFLQCTKEKMVEALRSLLEKKLIDISESRVFGILHLYMRCRYFAEDFK